MFNNSNNNIISKSQLHQEIIKNTVLDDLFAKTISFTGVQYKFHIDIPEILSYEKRLQERKYDIEKFTNLVMSDLENTSHNDMVMEIYKNDFFGSDYESEILSELSVNEKLLKDLL